MASFNIPTLAPRTAAYASAAAWSFNFLCQMYGMLSTPNMKDIAVKYHAFLSPLPIAIAVFFFPQTILQVYWIYRLYKQSSATSSPLGDADGHDDLNDLSGPDQEDDEEAVPYAPFFILGNISIGLWMVFWNGEHLILSDILVNINSASQLYYCFARLSPISQSNKLTHLVAKMFAGIGVLDVVDNASSAFLNYDFTHFEPGLVSYLLAIAAAAGLGFISDPIFGACLVYCWLALFLGQLGQGLWAFILLICAGITAGVVVVKHAKDKDLYLGLLKGENGSVV